MRTSRSWPRGTVWNILAGGQLRPHKIEYCLEKRDPAFEEEMAQVLAVYKLGHLVRKGEQARAESGEASEAPLAVLVR